MKLDPQFVKLVKLCAEGLAAVKAEQEMDSILGVLLQTGTEVCFLVLELEGLPILILHCPV